MSLRLLSRSRRLAPLLPLPRRTPPTSIPTLSLSRGFTSTPPPRSASEPLDYPPPPLFQLTETESLLRDTVSRFAATTLLPKVRSMDESETMDPDIIRELFAQGLMGIEIPESHGGAGMGFGAAIVAIEELAKVDPSVSVLCDVHNTLVNTAFLRWGSPGLRDVYLPKLAGEEVGSFCLSEPSSGSDAFAMLTTAAATGDGSSYVLNGSKCWITNAGHASVFLVFAQTNPTLPPAQRYKGITCFVIPASTPGLTVGKKERKLGIRASSTCVVTLDEVRVAADHVLGEVGEGYKIAMGLLNEGRVGIGAQMVGLAQGAWEAGARYVWSERKQFGRFVGEFQGLGFQVAEARVEIEAARALVYSAVRTKEGLDRVREAGGEVGREEMSGFVMQAAMAKLYASRVAQSVSGAAVEWMGGMGFVRDGLAEKFWRDSKIGAIYEGVSLVSTFFDGFGEEILIGCGGQTSNIQLQTIAKLLQKEYQQ